MTTRLILAMALAASLTLAAGYVSAGRPLVAVVVVVLGFGWAVGAARGPTWTISAGLVWMSAAAAIATFLDTPFALNVLGLTGALAAWDLAHFGRRLRPVRPGVEVQRLERAHLIRLGIVCVLGATLAVVAPLVQARFTFNVALLLALLALLGLSRAIATLRHEST